MMGSCGALVKATLSDTICMTCSKQANHMLMKQLHIGEARQVIFGWHLAMAAPPAIHSLGLLPYTSHHFNWVLGV